MVKRYDINPDDMPDSDENHLNGFINVVLYTDHAAEVSKFKEAERLFREQMREVLALLEELSSQGPHEGTQTQWIEKLKTSGNIILDKYSHYLDKGE